MLQSLKRHRRLVALVLVSLLAVGGWLAVAQSQGVTYDAHIIAPNCVPAGVSINGYVSGGTPPYLMTVSSNTSPSMGFTEITAPYTDPYMFTIPTFEPMKGDVVTITVTSSGVGEKVATHHVQIQ